MSKVALLIGINEYGSGLRSLPAAPKDVAAMQVVLQNAELGGFDLVKPLINPNHWEMEREIELWFRDRQRDDLVLLFFSGHGIKDERGDLYLAASNTQKDERGELIKSTAVAASFLHNCSRDSKSKRQVLILDCCFSGAFGNFVARDDSSLDLERQLGAEGRVVLASTSAIQYSYEEKDVDLSIYTRYLVEGIQTGVADQDNDGFISVQELHEYASHKVQETAPGMNPKIIVLKDEGFDIKIAIAKVSDPQLKYRREVERYAKRGEIPTFGRMILDTLREQLHLSLETAADIEEEVLRPYCDRLNNIQRYRDAYAAAINAEFPLSPETRKDLKHYQDMLGLRREDVQPIETELSPEPAAAPQPLAQKNDDQPNKSPVTQELNQPTTQEKIAAAIIQTAPPPSSLSRTDLRPTTVVPNLRRKSRLVGIVTMGLVLLMSGGYLGYHYWQQAQQQERDRQEQVRQAQAEAEAAKQRELEKAQQLEQTQQRERETVVREQEKAKALAEAQQKIEEQQNQLATRPTIPNTLGLVCISNQTGYAIQFFYRWSQTDANPWIQGSVAPGNWAGLYWKYNVPGENQSPPLDIRVDTDRTNAVFWTTYRIAPNHITAMPEANCNQIGSRGYTFRLENGVLKLFAPNTTTLSQEFS